MGLLNGGLDTDAFKNTSPAKKQTHRPEGKTKTLKGFDEDEKVKLPNPFVDFKATAKPTMDLLQKDQEKIVTPQTKISFNAPETKEPMSAKPTGIKPSGSIFGNIDRPRNENAAPKISDFKKSSNCNQVYKPFLPLSPLFDAKNETPKTT